MITDIERALVKSLTDLAILTSQLGESQNAMAGFIANRMPGLSDYDKQVLLAPLAKNMHDLKSYQEKAEKLRDAVG